jgi:tRNA-uridine 2-sulfurtransferase
MNKARVAVALSGGMDSSVAAYLLKESGYLVEGVHAFLHDSVQSQRQAYLAERLCVSLGISFQQIDLQEEFRHFVIDYFFQEYRRGRTPNPCLACNQYIKFGLLLNKVLSSGVDYMATGHYARIGQQGSHYRLFKAVDAKKDQTYFLYMLNQEQLRHILFPLGDCSRDEIQLIAKQKELPLNIKSSQDVCFISSREKCSVFLNKRFPIEIGEIVDTTGKLLSHHQGVAFYTIGQRHGLGLSSPDPLYVVKIDPESNKLVLGTEADLYSRSLIAKKLNWIFYPPSSPAMLTSRIRYKSKEVKSILSLTAHSARVRFQLAQRAVTPGQAIVFYQDGVVLGGGIIEKTASNK